MGFKDMIDKAKDSLGIGDQVKDKAKEAVDKVGDTIDQKTGGKFKDQVDQVQGKAKEAVDKLDDIIEKKNNN